MTDPLIIYQNYITRKVLRPDGHQLRAAKEFQKLYYRVKDYVPPQKAELELQKLIKKIQLQIEKSQSRPQLIKWIKNKVTSTPSNSTELVEVLSEIDVLVNMKTPQGLLLNGEVGCGKSMLMDMFAYSLPHASKGRWHYHNFMLWVYGRINKIQQRKARYTTAQDEMILFEIACEMIHSNTVLILDEFALPDIAAAKIVKILFTFFFKLGGVFVATSNRLPEDLYATDFRKKEFRSFLTVLESRCITLDMTSDNDYRKLLTEKTKESSMVVKLSPDHENTWKILLNKHIRDRKGQTDSLMVYGREVQVPWLADGIARFEFEVLCNSLKGPGDYISLASKYHTFIIDNVPVFSATMKSQARRFITLLDELYEARCQLVVRTEAELDDLFFPDSKLEQEDKLSDMEMYSRTQQDLISPYRPNVATYENRNSEFQDQMANLEKTNFTSVKKFTGEDEKFAYKRAVSRIREMTQSEQWRTKPWSPVSNHRRPWELSINQMEANPEEDYEAPETIKALQAHENSKARQAHAPGFSSQHFWSVGNWPAPKRLSDAIALKWIQGVSKK